MPPALSEAPSRLLTAEQTAEMLGIAPQTLSVWRSTARYPLPYVRVGRCVRYRLADVERYIAAQTVHCGAPE